MRFNRVLTAQQLVIAIICSLFISSPALASFAGVSPQVIGEFVDIIEVTGNERTQESFILSRTGLYPGQVLGFEMLKKARQALRDTGLFRQIDFRSEIMSDGRLKLLILLYEKNFTLLLPRLSRNGDGDVKIGLRLRMHNIQGADQTLEMLLQQEEESDGEDSEQIRLRYKWPLLGRPYTLRWRLSQTIENKNVEDFDNVETIDRASMSVSRDWHFDPGSTPLTVSAGLALEKRKLVHPYPEDLEAREAGTFNRISISLSYDDLHSEEYRRFGQFYVVGVSQGTKSLDSDYESTILTFEAKRFKRLDRHNNFNFRIAAAVSNNSPFDFLRYDIGGASDIRGLEDNDDRGDARVFGNFEYVVGYRRAPTWRSTYFIDVGNVYLDLNDIDLSDLHYTIGTGLRWKIRSFVKTDLFLDYGYDIEEDEGKIYGGTSLAF